MNGGASRSIDDGRGIDRGELEGLDEIGQEGFRLGHDVRFLFVAVGGGGIRVGREVARKHPKYVETIAIHSDTSVQGFDEFDRRVTLEPEAGEEPDGPTGVGTLARAAEPALERIFDRAAFVTIVASLGGSSGTGILPSVVEAASRSAVVVSVFAIKPFHAEGDRRGLAERALGRLHFIEPFVEKQQHHLGRLQVLDNEALALREPRMPFNGVARHWADLLTRYMEREFVHPAEAAVEAGRLSRLAEEGPMNPLPLDGPTFVPESPESIGPGPGGPRLLPAALAAPSGLRDAELTFEIELPSAGEPRL